MSGINRLSRPIGRGLEDKVDERWTRMGVNGANNNEPRPVSFGRAIDELMRQKQINNS